jgi:hypothetical protein
VEFKTERRSDHNTVVLVDGQEFAWVTQGYGSREWRVNWASFGAVPPAQAETYARAILQAVGMARELNEENAT